MGLVMICVVMIVFAIWFLRHVITTLVKDGPSGTERDTAPPPAARADINLQARDDPDSLAWTALDEHQLNRLLDGG